MVIHSHHNIGNKEPHTGFLIGWVAVLVLIFFYVSDPSRFYFANDDFIHIPLSGKKFFGQSVLLRPISEFTLFIDHTIWGKNAFGYHLTNILIHLLNVILVFSFARLLYLRFRREVEHIAFYRAFLVACLFLVYPFHGEAIYWIIGRGASLGCFFTLLSLCFYLKRKERARNIFLSFFFFILGCFAYETTFALPMMITIFYLYERRQPFKGGKQVQQVLLYWLVFLALLSYRIFLTRNIIGDYEAVNLINFNGSRLFYNLNTFVARSFIPPLLNSRLFLAIYAVSIIALGVLCIHAFRKKKIFSPFFILLSFLYVVALIPVISLGIDTHDTESDRFLYLPSVFFLMMCVEILTYLFTSLQKQFIAAVLISIYFLGFTWLFAKQYQHAAVITRTSLNYLNEKHEYGDLYAFQLPSQYKGATIFRSGFQAALLWICPELKFKMVYIISQKEIMRKAEIFTGKQVHFSELSKVDQHRFLEMRDSLFVVSGNSKGNELVPGNNDLVVVWTDSSIAKIKQ